MEDPVIGDVRLAKDPFDTHFTITDLKTPNSAEDDLSIALVAKTRSQFESAPSGSKKIKSKPLRIEISATDAQKEHPPHKLTIQQGVHDHLNPHLSFPKEKLTTKRFKNPLSNPPVMIRALDVQSRLGTKFPSFIKTMVKSQVTCGFWMGLPLSFCKSFLPNEDTSFILEDESGHQFEAKFIAYKNGFSAGWKAFAINHNLTDGDVLIFHLVESFKFKVYILKGNDSNEVDGALSPLNLESPTGKITQATPSFRRKRSKLPESLPLAVVQKNYKNSTPSSRSLPNSQLNIHRIERSRNYSEEVGSEVLEGNKSYKIDLSFQQIKTFEDFCNAIKELCLDSELSDELRMGYYKLCLDRKQFIHDGLREGLFYKLVAGIIGEIVIIANEIKNCKPTTTQDEFEGWDNTLKCFELLGMKVGFLRDRIHTLANMIVESEGALDIKSYLDSKNKHKRIKDEIKNVGAKLLELMETEKKFAEISSSLKKKAKKYKQKFQYEVDAPW